MGSTASGSPADAGVNADGATAVDASGTGARLSPRLGNPLPVALEDPKEKALVPPAGAGAAVAAAEDASADAGVDTPSAPPLLLAVGSTGVAVPNLKPPPAAVPVSGPVVLVGEVGVPVPESWFSADAATVAATGPAESGTGAVGVGPKLKPRRFEPASSTEGPAVGADTTAGAGGDAAGAAGVLEEGDPGGAPNVKDVAAMGAAEEVAGVVAPTASASENKVAGAGSESGTTTGGAFEGSGAFERSGVFEGSGAFEGTGASAATTAAVDAGFPKLNAVAGTGAEVVEAGVATGAAETPKKLNFADVGSAAGAVDAGAAESDDAVVATVGAVVTDVPKTKPPPAIGASGAGADAADVPKLKVAGAAAGVAEGAGTAGTAEAAPALDEFVNALVVVVGAEATVVPKLKVPALGRAAKAAGAPAGAEKMGAVVFATDVPTEKPPAPVPVPVPVPDAAAGTPAKEAGGEFKMVAEDVGADDPDGAIVLPEAASPKENALVDVDAAVVVPVAGAAPNPKRRPPDASPP